MACRLHRVDVSPQEEKLPAVLFLLPLDHFFHLPGRIAAAGILHAVGGDNKKSVFRHILGPGVLMDVSDVVDGSADGVQQGGAAPDLIVLLSERLDLVELEAVVEHLHLGVKEHRGDVGLAGLPLLLLQHGVEAADGVPLQALHGAAAVQDKDQFRSVLFHCKTPYAVFVSYKHSIGGFGCYGVACRATFVTGSALAVAALGADAGFVERNAAQGAAVDLVVGIELSRGGVDAAGKGDLGDVELVLQQIVDNFKAAPHNLARAFGQRFCLIRKL